MRTFETGRGMLRPYNPFRLWPAFVLAGMLLVWVWPILWVPGGWWDAHSKWSDLLRGLGVVEAWRCGLWDARWFPGFDYGYGYPFLSYYAPLFCWLSGLWILVVTSPTVALRVNLISWLVFGTAGMYMAGERLWDFLTHGRAARLRPGLMCAMGWLMSPYLLCNAFVRGALAEFASCQTAPWVIWAACGILGRESAWDRRDSRELLLLVLFLSLGILAHNFFGMCMFGIGVALLPLVLAVKWFGSESREGERNTNGIRSVAWIAGLGWALLTTVFYWLPALWESEFVRLDRLIEPDYSYLNHFLYAGNLTNIFYWGYGVSGRGPHDEMPLHLGLVGVVGLASAVLAIVIAASSRKRRDSRLLAGIGAIVLMTAAGLLLTTSLGRFVWDRIPPLRFAQFPWRLLNIPTIGICLLLPAAVVTANPTRHRPAMAGAIVVLVVCFAVSEHFYGHIRGPYPMNEEHKPENWEKTQILTADMDEYGPLWRDRYRPPQWPRGSLLKNDQVEVMHFENRRVDLRATVNNRADKPQPLVVALNYFPGWQGRVEPGNAPLTLSPGPATAFILIENVPPAESTIHIWFGDTPIRRTCKIMSGIAWLVWIGAGIVLVAKSSIFSCNRGTAHL